MPRLIVAADDEGPILDLLVAVLEEEGYRVLRAADGAAALALIERERVDLLITDNMMPRLGGLALIARLRAPGTPVIPIILMSAVSPRPRPAPPVVFLAKPFDLDHLLALVDQQLGG